MLKVPLKTVYFFGFLWISVTAKRTENKTVLLLAEENDNSKYLNNFVNITNSSPELIDYYDLDISLDDNLHANGVIASPPPDIIYPDPQKMLSNNKKLNALNGNVEVDDDDDDDGDDEGDDGAADDDNIEGGKNDDMQHYADITARHDANGIDDGVKDENFRGHNAIDNIMYIYYGSNSARRKSLGGSIIIVGAVFALAAQILAIILSLLRNRRIRRQNHLSTTTMNLLSTLCASNFIFIVGVQSSKSLVKCEMIAILLHYFHLTTAITGLCYAYSIYDFVINENVPNAKHNNLISYCGSGVYVMFSFAVTSSSYETIDFCWMSVQRGMIVNFMIPISALIVATTVLGTLTLKSVVAKQREVMVENIDNILEKCQQIDAAIMPCQGNDKNCDEIEKVCDTELKRVDFYDSKFDLGALSIADLSLQSSIEPQDYSEFKNAVKFSLFFQPTFAVCWFLGVVALENRHSCVMPVAFIVCYNILNWYILYRLDSICPIIITINSPNSLTTSTLNCSQYDTKSNNDDGIEQQQLATDTIPLLCSVTTASNPIKIPYEDPLNAGDSWETKMENINLDCISTISN